MLTEILKVKHICYTRSHNSGNIHGEYLHIWVVERKKIISRKLKYIFAKKTTPQLSGHIRLQNIEERKKIWVTCHCLSDACWH